MIPDGFKFSIKELVDPKTYKEWGENAWQLLNEDALLMLHGIRTFIDRPITVNSWDWRGALQYRGFRPADCPVGARASWHKSGRAFDFDVQGMSAVQVRKLLLENQDDSLLLGIMRMEDRVPWVHADNAPLREGQKRIYLFSP